MYTITLSDTDVSDPLFSEILLLCDTDGGSFGKSSMRDFTVDLSDPYASDSLFSESNRLTTLLVDPFVPPYNLLVYFMELLLSDCSCLPVSFDVSDSLVD